MKLDFFKTGIVSRPVPLLLLLVELAACINPFTLDTARLLGAEVEPGIVVSFADVNVDRRVDILIIDPLARAVDAILMAKEGPGKRVRLLTAPSSSSGVILGVVPADYNGDSRVDLALVIGPKSGGGPVELYISYGQPLRPTMGTPTKLDVELKEQPLLLDWNGDMIADLMGESNDGKTTVLIGSTNDNFTTESFAFSAWDQPGFSAFIDINHDLQPDILITTKSNYQFILKDAKTFVYDTGTPTIVNKPTPTQVLGGPVFFDFNMNDEIEMVVPACKDADCVQSLFYIYSFTEKKWAVADANFTVAGQSWGFIPGGSNPLSGYLPMPVSVRVGDVDLDGLPDIVAVLQSVSGGRTERRIGLFLGLGQGAFRLVFPVPAGNVSLVGLFDFHDTGRLGFLTISGSPPRMNALMQMNKEDGYFLKVMVLNGLCGPSCPEETPPYGLPVPGPIATYDTEKPDGGRQVSMAQQVTQSSYLALQLPYNIFGLGSFANYIEKLDVQLPNQVGVGVDRKKEFTFIVPKSQLVVLPYPLNEPSRWKTKLFLEPFKDVKVLYVAAALLGTIFLVAIVSGILHWRERREDLQEKLQEAQKFHFDAM